MAGENLHRIDPIAAPRAIPATPARARARSLSRTILVDIVRLADAAVVAAAAALSFLAYPVARLNLAGDWDRYAAAALVGLFVALAVFDRMGLYDFRRLHERWRRMPRTAVAWTATILIVVLLAFLTKVSEEYSRGWLILWYAGGLVALIGVRAAIATYLRSSFKAGTLHERVAIVGAGQEGQEFAERLCDQGVASDVAVLGFYDDRATRVPQAVADWRILGDVHDLVDEVRRGVVDRVVVALPASGNQRIAEVLRHFDGLAVDIDLYLAAPKLQLPRSEVLSLGRIAMLRVSERPLKDWHLFAKWVEDKVLASCALVLLGPLMLLIGLAIRLESPGPVLFRQPRFGFNNEPVVVFKFRTMYIDHCDPGGAQRTVREDPRVTPLGRWLRRLSLDELPQFLNVLNGSMSLVGPRAHPVQMQAAGRLYHEAVRDYLRRHRVKPGITGWAQVNGLRGEIDSMTKARRRVDFDLYYIENWSLMFDLRVLLLTVARGLRDPNAY